MYSYFRISTIFLFFCNYLFSQKITSEIPYYKIDLTTSFLATLNLEKNEDIESVELDSIRYISDGLSIKGYVLKPKKIFSKLPIIIFNRGGNGNFGNLTPKLMLSRLSSIASKGYVIFGSTYRGNSDSEGFDEFAGEDVNDILNLISIAKKNIYVDSTKIALYGWSRGGIMTYKALRNTKDKNIKTAIIGGAPSDIFKLLEERPLFETDLLSKRIPNFKQNRDNEIVNRSAIFWVKDLPKIPFLIVHGKNDNAVNYTQSIDMCKEFAKESIPNELIIYENEGHNINENKENFDIKLTEWLSKIFSDTVL